ncbi:MAG: aminotransferase class I/II-fold pyridoxal phosphate-dependent enzyme [Kiritimatiellae bacterium]|nr:aminotransferase class I/II-fold pyridoxal phosphate-dependent enzyme [Kiritimatiellia bacterium]
MRIAKHVRKLEEYVPGEQPKGRGVVKLNTNENPYPPSPACAKVLAGFDLDRLRRYPDPNYSELREALAALNGTTPERVFVGNGSDEVLSITARCFVEDDETIASLDPSYSLYKTLAAIRNVRWTGPSGVGPKCSLFLWTNPNAPTGSFAEPAEIAAFASKFRGVVIVDEAYADFARANCMSLATAEGNRNLIVMRTFSKSYSLAGLRVGYCVGPEDLVRAMYKVKDSYNVDAVAQAVALAAVKDQKWMKANAAKVVRTRERFSKALEERGWDVPHSESNFVFARPPATAGVRASGKAAHERAEAVFHALRKANIIVRYFKGPKTGDRIRITIGTDKQMDTLTRAIDELSIR